MPEDAAEVSKNRPLTIAWSANSWSRDTSAVTALSVVADTTRLPTAGQLHGGGWVCLVQVATMLRIMQERQRRCERDVDDVAMQVGCVGCVVVG